MNTQNLIEKLKSVGFKEYESKVFIVLLKGIPMSASEIAKDAKIIRNSIYDILKSFVQKGFCNEIETNTILNYQIIDPEIVMDKIMREYTDGYHNKLESLKDTFTELKTIYNAKSEKNEGADLGIQLIRGINAHRVAKYADLLKKSRLEVLGMYRLKWLVSDDLNEDAIRIVKGGGVVKTIYQVSPDFKIVKGGKAEAGSAEELIKVCESFRRNGEDVRLSEVKIPNITVFDKENIFINMTGEKNVPKYKQADIIIKNEEFAQHMRDLFNFYWNQSITIDEYKKRNRI